MVRHQAQLTLRGLCSALLPPEEGGPDPSELAAMLGAFLDRQPRFISVATRAGALGIDLASILMHGSRLASGTPRQRQEVLRRLAHISLLAGGVDGLKALVMLVAGADRYAEETLSHARSTEPARPDAQLDLTPSADWPGFCTADAVVVGSGAGGAMAARTLARAGMSVVVVEEGRRHAVDEFRSHHPLRRFADLYRDGGLTAALGAPPVILPIGRAVGGTTVVNSGTCYRTPDAVLRRWRDDAGLAMADPEAFGPYLDDVWATLEVAAVPLAIMGRNGRLMLQGAEALGWRAGPITRNAPGCDGCCQCAIGCPRNAKFGVHLNALPQACAQGARIVCDARVERILLEGAQAGESRAGGARAGGARAGGARAGGARAVGVEARRKDGTFFAIRSDVVVVAAGTTETPLLLRRSELGRHPRLGLNMAIHPSVGVMARFEEPVVAWRGVLQSAAIDHFHESDGILVEATSTPPGMSSVQLHGYGGELLGALDEADHMATLGAMVADLPSGRVHGKRRALMRYNLHRRDASRLVKAIGIMGRTLFAAGATQVSTGVASHPRAHNPQELEEALSNANPRQLHLAAFHPVGTAAAGSDPERFCVDSSGALRGVSGVWLADGSVLPTCPEVNPQVSIMAMAQAIASNIVSSA